MERKEAIEVIKKNYPDSSFTMLREALETLIPELKESDDEKVRKTLIKFFEDWHTTNSHCYGVPLPKILSWLEKQGEQKETLCDKCKKTQPSHSCQDITALRRCALEKQGEYKPAFNIDIPF